MIHIGTTGWDYTFWDKEFYPKKIVKKLPYYSKISAFTELRSTYTQLPSTDKVRTWATSTPDDFMFISRMSRDILSDRTIDETAISHFFDSLGGLDNKHQMSMLHFSSKFQRDETSEEYLTKLLECIEKSFSGQILLDISNRSWFVEDVKSLLRSHSAALVGTDKRPVATLMKDPDVYYLRLAGDTRTVPQSELGKVSLDRSKEITFWADHLKFLNTKTRSIFIAVDNHFSGNAITDIYQLVEELRRRKLPFTGFKQS